MTNRDCAVIQVADEIQLFQESLDTSNHDDVRTYLEMLYGKTISDDDVHLAIVYNREGCYDAMDYLVGRYNEKFQFICFRIFEPDKLKKILKRNAEMILEHLGYHL